MTTLKINSGDYFSLINPEGSKLGIGDIAHALSNICRFGGHVTKFYSVAQHCVLASRVLDLSNKQQSMNILMHDAAEAIIGDMPSPLKRLCPDFKVIEAQVERAIFPFFGVPYPLPNYVKIIDLKMLVTEKRDLMPTHEDDEVEWQATNHIKPLKIRIVPWSAKQAKREFLCRYEELIA